MPQVSSEQTYADYLAGRDTVLEQAIAVLRGGAGSWRMVVSPVD